MSSLSTARSASSDEAEDRAVRVCAALRWPAEGESSAKALSFPNTLKKRHLLLYDQLIKYMCNTLNIFHLGVGGDNFPSAGSSFNLHINVIFLSHQKIADRSRALLPPAQKERKQVSRSRGAVMGWSGGWWWGNADYSIGIWRDRDLERLHHFIWFLGLRKHFKIEIVHSLNHN